MTAAEIVKALGGQWRGSYGVARCPAHEDRNPSLSVSDGDGRTLLRCHAGCDQQSIMDALRAMGMWGRCDDAPIPQPRPKGRARASERDDDAKRTAAAIEIWKGSHRARDGTDAETYLRNRGITIPLPSTIRSHSALKHHPTGQHYPCMIAAVQNRDGRLVAIHRTYLTADGRKKAVVSSPKMALGPLNGHAVRLAHAGDTLALCEGIENALSLLQMTGNPTWALCGTAGFKTFHPPPGVKALVLGSDADPAGDKVIDEAAPRFAEMGLKVLRLRPPEGHDFNDVILDFEERAAIREYDGGADRTEAEFYAFAETIGGTVHNAG